MMMIATKFVILMSVTVARISATSQGAPEAACESMTPQHGVSPQTTDSPYNVKVREDHFVQKYFSI